MHTVACYRKPHSRLHVHRLRLLCTARVNVLAALDWCVEWNRKVQLQNLHVLIYAESGGHVVPQKFATADHHKSWN